MCYIVGGFPSINDIRLASLLNYPLYCGDALMANKISLKSESKLLFQKCGIQTAKGITIPP
jgi:hypothetical protein